MNTFISVFTFYCHKFHFHTSRFRLRNFANGGKQKNLCAWSIFPLQPRGIARTRNPVGGEAHGLLSDGGIRAF